MLRFDTSCCPTEEEWLDGLKRSGLRRAGKGRLILQTVALAAAGGISLVTFFLDNMTVPMSAVIALAAFALIPVMWFVPLWKMRSTARAAAEDNATVHLWMFDDGFDFSQDPSEKPYFRFDEAKVTFPAENTCDTLVLRFKNDDVVVLPHRCFSEEQWDMLTAAFADPF